MTQLVTAEAATVTLNPEDPVEEMNPPIALTLPEATTVPVALTLKKLECVALAPPTAEFVPASIRYWIPIPFEDTYLEMNKSVLVAEADPVW